MALALLATLSAAARAAYPIIKKGVRSGLTSRQINDVIKNATGKGIRRQTLLDIIRAEKGVAELGAQLKFLGIDRLPNPQRIPLALTKLRRKYSFKVRMTGILNATGERMESFINVSSDSLLTRGQIESIAHQIDLQGKSLDHIDVEDVTLVEAVRAGSEGTI